MDKISNLIDVYINEEYNIISNLSNISAILYACMKDVNWVGFYYADEINKQLFLGPFQGLAAVSNIRYENGVCGECATKKEIIVVADVCNYPGHIACDINSKSEIVLPILKEDGSLYAVLDIDSPIKNRFNLEEKQMLQMIVKEIESLLNKK